MGRTERQLSGDSAESLVAGRLAARGWTIFGRNLRLGKSELDILAADPGPPARLVVVEVRWRRSRGFGGAEESLDYRKRTQLRIGLARLLEGGVLPDGSPLPGLPVAVDFAVVEPGPGGRPQARLYRNALEG
ncbi:MAG: YraN family protein [Candidatus Limnocylindrales bacterium]|jgi:putative endonuclease